MRQVQIDVYGGPEVLHLIEVPDPQPGAGQVVVRTAAAGITFVETQVRAGRSPRPGPGPALPIVLGNGIEGEIVALGAGVDPSMLGRRVVTATGGFGGYADRVVVDAADPVPVPDGLALGEAVALLADGRTALALTHAAALTTADRALITAAAGGVGSLLVQLAHAGGTRQIVAAAGGERKLALARELGAAVAVDYRRDGWAGEVRAAAGGIDIVFDGVGGRVGADALGLLVSGGRLLVYGAASGAMTDTTGAASRGITHIAGYTLVRSPGAEPRIGCGSAGHGRGRALAARDRPDFPLSRAADAHAAIEARATTGKTLLLPDS